MEDTPALFNWLFDELADPANAWSIGTFGAIGEFMRDGDEPACCTRSVREAEIVTGRGGMRLTETAGVRAIAYETPSSTPDRWSHGIALCLRASDCAAHPRSVLTCLGPDTEALRPEDRDAILFDLGLSAPQVTACIRTKDPDLLSTLDAGSGRGVFEPGNPVMAAIVAASPHRIFVTRLGRLEVYQPIPPANGLSPEGPHTHVLPKLLQSGRTHAATLPVPAEWIPCAYLFPPIAAAHGDLSAARSVEGFQDLLRRYGLPELVALKHETEKAVARGDDPASFRCGDDRHSRAVVKVALRQLRALGQAPEDVSRWSAVFD